LLDDILVGEDVGDGGVAEGSVGRVEEVGEEGLVDDHLSVDEVVVHGGHDGVESVLVGDGGSAEGLGHVADVLDGRHLGSDGHGIADFLIVDEQVGNLDDGVELLGLVLGADEGLNIDELVDVVGEGNVDVWDLDSDGFLDQVDGTVLKTYSTASEVKYCLREVLGRTKTTCLSTVSWTASKGRATATNISFS